MNNIYNFNSYSSINTWNSPEPINYTYGGKNYTNYIGNYWDDYADVDEDCDGIYGNPYNISEEMDNYPLVKPFEKYFGQMETTIKLKPGWNLISIPLLSL